MKTKLFNNSPASWRDTVMRAKRMHKRILCTTLGLLSLLVLIVSLAAINEYMLDSRYTSFSFSENYRLFQLVILFLVLVLLIVIISSWRMHHSTITALKHITNSSFSISREHTDNIDALPKSSTEVGELVESIESMRIMLDAMPVSCFVWDRNHNIIDANDIGAKFFKFKSRDELITRFHECSPEYQPNGWLSNKMFEKNMEDAFEQGKIHFEWMHQIPSTGEEAPTEVTLVRMDYGGEYVVAGYMHDIKEHRYMLNEIESRGHLLQTVNTAAEILLQAEPEYFELSLFRSINMIAQASGIGRVFIWEHVSEDDNFYFNQIYEVMGEAADFQRTNRRVFYNDNETNEIESRLLRGLNVTGNTKDLLPETVEALLLADTKSFLFVPMFLRGKMWGVIGFCNTDGEYNLSENDEAILLSGGLLVVSALFRYEITLSQKSTAAELEVALHEAQAASKAKGNFLSSMSHEMRTPMNAIFGMSALGKKSEDITYKDYAFDKIKGASDHLLGVINDVLDMSKIEAGMLTISDVVFSLKQTLNNVVAINNFRIEEKRQRLTVDIDPELPNAIIADDHRLAQVLTNLVSNAIKFTPNNKEIYITAKLKEKCGDTCTIQFSVVDQGIGLSDEQQAILFRPFVQAEASTNRKYGGTGLGLAISKHIVELMDGEIWVESNPEEGAAFHFVINAKIPDTNATIAITEHDFDVSFSGKCLLLAEDIEINQEIVIAMLENTGIEIVCAENGEEALKMFTENPNRFDIIFMDIHMPIMDGYDATKTMRKVNHPAANDVPIIAMTANVFREDIEKCLEAGMNDHIGKPLDFAIVFAVLTRYLYS